MCSRDDFKGKAEGDLVVILYQDLAEAEVPFSVKNLSPLGTPLPKQK